VDPGWSGPAAVAVKDRLFRALAVLRLVVLLNAVALNVYRRDDFVHPWAGAGCVLAMVAWTAYATRAYAVTAPRSHPQHVVDLAQAVALLLLSPVVKDSNLVSTVPGFWVMAALLAWAVHYRVLGGLVAGVCLTIADLSVRGADITQANYGNAFLLVIGGPIVGYMCESLQRMAAERDRAERAAATAAERARLARVVHDGVLQVLALVQRRAHELGGDAEELGRLAGEQEQALRSMIRVQDAALPTPNVGTLDLAAELSALERRPGVTVATPGGRVELPGPVVTELVAAVVACLDNVARHVGEGEPVWVLLESWPDRAVVSVRDDGPGIAEGRLAEAEREGRLGVVQSIRGRLADLGGSADLSSGPSGTEWELSVPVEPWR
jgi:signal transduction histidine kinase